MLDKLVRYNAVTGAEGPPPLPIGCWVTMIAVTGVIILSVVGLLLWMW
ncbi:MAG: hypothetical protein QGG36_20385 [Pirellulaceae bacterium]|jgi:hypothetical protein|nr:hypothetical protein [Pirellulaceae bacterium]MDP7018174.1 hypothetical protein [Pirellulaceae bacterium]